MIVSANLSTNQVKPALSPHLMVVTRSDVYSTIITKMSIANCLVLIFYYFGHHLPSPYCARSQPGSEHFRVSIITLRCCFLLNQTDLSCQKLSKAVEYWFLANPIKNVM